MNEPTETPAVPIGAQIASQACACGHFRAQHAGGTGNCYGRIEEGDKRGDRCGCQLFFSEHNGAPAELAIGPTTDDPRSEWIECVKMLGLVMNRLDGLASRQNISRAGLLLKMSAPFTVTLYPKEVPTVRPTTQLRGIVKFLRENFINDGAEGESVHALCDAVQKILEDLTRAQRWNETLEAELADAREEQGAPSNYEEKRRRAEAMLKRLYAFYLEWQHSHEKDVGAGADWDTFKDWVADEKPKG